MKITFLERAEIFELVKNNRENFLKRILETEVFIVKRFYDPKTILDMRSKIFESGLKTDPSWHPLFDGCPDYHRLHENYAQAHVKSRMHGFYFHGWPEKNAELFSYFGEIFELKCLLAGGLNASEFIRQIPSDGVIARVNFQNYPSGGGCISEHVDPKSNYALIQRLVQGSNHNQDFKEGGLYARKDLQSEKVYLDQHTEAGDLMILSPAIPHGVDPIDPQAVYDWRQNSGKWTILPLFVSSDYPSSENQKPKEINIK